MTDERDDMSLPPGERWIVDEEDITIEVKYTDESVLVQFKGFEDEEAAEEYANTLAEVLPLLLYGSTTLQ